MSIRIRQAPSGKLLEGTINGQVPVWNNTTKSWDVGTPSGGSVAPLTRDFYSDPGKVGSTEDGSIANPFLTAAAGVAAIAALPPGVKGALLLADADYSSEDLVISSRMSLRSIGESRGSVFFNSITVNGGSLVTFYNICTAGLTVENVIVEVYGSENLGVCSLLSSGGGSGILRLYDCNATAVIFSDSNQGLILEDCTIQNGVTGSPNPAASGSVLAVNSTCGTDLQSSTIECFNVTCNSLVAQGAATIRQGRALLIAVIGALTTDSATLSYARLNGGFISAGSLIVSDRLLRKTVSFTVPALTASFADVTAAVAGCVAGDNFVVASLASNRLANVGIVDAFCDADGTLTLRVFGTNGGGTLDCNVSVLPNS